MPKLTRYTSYLVRLWQEADEDPASEASQWQGEVEHVQSGERLAFSGLDALPALLQRHTERLQQPPAQALLRQVIPPRNPANCQPDES
jgi:hypothetical protein